MFRSIFIRILLFPFSLLYGLGVAINNLFYRSGLLKSAKFSLPVISIGNLTVGGTGKTPHIEYLIDLLKDRLKLATLSRGYGRKTKGFLLASEHNSALEIGDEPLQFHRKFPELVVAVAESRALGIPRMIQKHPDIQTVLLDDAFQHRSVQPSLNILLTEYKHPYFKDFLLPSGRLREWPSGAQRADGIIVSKCPQQRSEINFEEIRSQMRLKQHQKLFFSYFHYDHPYNIFNPVDKLPLKDVDAVFIVSAIAQTDYLMDYLENQDIRVQQLSFNDHHKFSNYEISRMIRIYQEMPEAKKIFLTTEKDAMRLELHKGYFLKDDIKVYGLPVQVKFHDYGSYSFDDYVKDHLLNFKA